MSAYRAQGRLLSPVFVSYAIFVPFDPVQHQVGPGGLTPAHYARKLATERSTERLIARWRPAASRLSLDARLAAAVNALHSCPCGT